MKWHHLGLNNNHWVLVPHYKEIDTLSLWPSSYSQEKRILPQVVAESEDAIVPQVVGLFQVPWEHHREITVTGTTGHSIQNSYPSDLVQAIM